jgi:hypothetical protein
LNSNNLICAASPKEAKARTATLTAVCVLAKHFANDNAALSKSTLHKFAALKKQFSLLEMGKLNVDRLQCEY